MAVNFFSLCGFRRLTYDSSLLLKFIGGFWDTRAVMHVEDCLWKGITVLFVWRYRSFL